MQRQQLISGRSHLVLACAPLVVLLLPILAKFPASSLTAEASDTIEESDTLRPSPLADAASGYLFFRQDAQAQETIEQLLAAPFVLDYSGKVGHVSPISVKHLASLLERRAIALTEYGQQTRAKAMVDLLRRLTEQTAKVAPPSEQLAVTYMDSCLRRAMEFVR